ncbi:phage tail tape measure protein [Empedobacter sp. 189-2]|uniref:phage tail tape measure protein n=1 Tax=Empedobacter sp. 189-2 TaxID=2746724 RepID=UPI0025772E2E|nr:phage tail tape measure protein [Empedobacter sp. 189-2]MDM1542042.1 phage tail tape measure protein [Empedobacter sp. 189-2]
MANKIHEEDIRLNISVNGNEAQKEIHNLEKRNNELSNSIKSVQAEMKKYRTAKQKESEEYKNLQSQLNKYNKELDVNRNKISQLTSTLKVNEMTTQQLKARAKELQFALSKMLNSTDRNRMKEQLAEVNAQLSKMNALGDQQRITFSSASGWLQRYQTHILSVAATITGLTYSLQQWMDFMGKLSDAESDVMKTASMTKTEIEDLSKSFGELDTRTSRINLLKIAEEGGRIGIAKNEMSDFVEVMDQVYVALGDSFTGGVEEVASKLGKLKMLFAETKSMDVPNAYNAIGSAINDLGANGVATESNIAEFTTRIGALPDTLKPSIADTLALGAAFEESGIEAEVSARAYSIFLNRASTETASFAQVMGLPVEKVKEMINANPLEFFLKFAERLKGINPEAVEMAQLLDKLKINADGANKVIGAAANNSERFRETIELSNQSFVSANSLINEFNIKNNNLAAIMDKVKKKFAEIFSSETLTNLLGNSVEWFGKLIGVVKDTDGSVGRFKTTFMALIKTIILISAPILGYNAGILLSTRLTNLWTNSIKANTLVQKASQIILTLWRATILLASAAKALLTGNTVRATAAMRLFNATLASNPLGVIISLLTTAIALFVVLKDDILQTKDAMNDLSASTNYNIEAEREFQKSLVATKSKIDPLISILKDNNTTLDVRKKTYDKLISQHPEFIGTVDKEYRATNKLTSAYDSLIKKLKEASRARALENVTQKRDQKLADALDAEFNAEIEKRKEDALNKKIEQENRKNAKKYADRIKSSTKESADLSYVPKSLHDNASKELEKSKALREQAQKESDEWNKYLANEFKKNPTSTTKPEGQNNSGGGLNLGGNSTGSSKNNSSSTSSTNEKEKSARQKFYDELIRDYEENQEELERLRNQYEDIKISNIEDEFDRELAVTNAEYLRIRKELENQKVSDSTFSSLYKARQEAYKKGDMEMVNKLDAVTQSYLQKNQEIDTLLLAEANEYSKKSIEIERNRVLKTLDNLTKSSNDKITEQKRLQTAELATISSVEDAKEILKRSLNDKELKNIKTWQDAKTALDKQYEAETLAAQQKFLEEQLSQLQAISQGSTDAGIDFNLLTPEQQEVISQQVEDLKNKINELIIAKNQLKGEQIDKENPNGDKSEGLQKASGGTTDIFGMNANDWQTLFDNLDEGKLKFEDVANVIGLMVNMYSQYAQMVAASENKSLQKFEENNNKRKDSLQKQLDQGFISQATYNAEVQKLDDAYNKRKAEIEYKQAKREKQMALVSAIMNTAAAVTEALPNWVLAGIVGTLGAIQVGMILKQPLPSKGFEDGYINIQREQDGKNFRAKKGGVAKSGLVSKPTHFLAGEQGQFFPEMIISGPQWKGFSPALKTAVLNEVNGIKSPGYEGGTMPDIASMQNPEIIALLSANFELLSDLKTNGIQAHLVNDMRFQQKMSDGNKKYQQFISKTKM